MADPSNFAPQFSVPDYYKILLQSSVVSQIVYEKNPRETLLSDFKHINHGISSLCVSQAHDEFNVRYIVCDCSTKTQKILIVGFCGTDKDNQDDIFTNLQTYGVSTKCQGRIHAGFYKRSEKIPIKYFAEKVLSEDNYKVVFTGHSLGASTASLITVKTLLWLKIKSENVIFIGFGSPVLACENFKKFIEPQFLNSFHFYINENDIVTKILSSITKVAHLGVLFDSKAFQSFFKLSSNKQNYDQIKTKDEKKSILKAIKDKITNLIPIEYTSFGKLFLLNRKSEIEDISGDNLSIVLKSLDEYVNDIHNHFMENYHLKILMKFKTLFGPDNLNPGLNHPAPASYLDLNIPDKSEWEDNKNASYHSLVLFDDITCHLNVTLECKNIEYATKFMLKIGDEYRTGKFDSINRKFYFVCDKNDLLDANYKLKQKKIKADLKSQFNNVEFEINIDEADVKFLCLTHREEKIMRLPPDLLYIYAAFYIHLFKDKINKNVTDLKQLLEDIDDTWKVDGTDNEYLKENHFTHSLITRFFIDEQKGELIDELKETLLRNISDLNLPQKYTKLSELSENSKDLFIKALPTASKFSELEGTQLKLKVKYEFKQIIGLVAVSIGSIGSLVAAFLKNEKLALAIAASSLSAVGYNFNFIKHWVMGFFESFEGYRTNVSILTETFDLTPENPSRYIYFYEKEVATKLLFFYNYSEEDIIGDWVNKFKNNFVLNNLDYDQKMHLIKIAKSIRINFKIREILLKDYFYGIMGKEKSGKSKFTEVVMSEESANSSQSEKTRELKAHKIIEANGNNFTFFDYPHFESEIDINHKLQFIFTRHLVDYFFLIVEANKTDNSDFSNVLKLFKSSCDSRFTILLNKADAFWMQRTNNQCQMISEDKFEILEREICKMINVDHGPSESDLTKRVFFTCLNYDGYTGNEIDYFKQLKHIYMPNKLRKVVFSKILNQLSRNVDNYKLFKPILTKRMNELENNYTMKQKMITIMENENDIRPVKAHAICNTVPCEVPKNPQPPLDHFDFSSFEELVTKLKVQYKMTNTPIITTQKENIQVKSIDEILKVETHSFFIKEK